MEVVGNMRTMMFQLRGQWQSPATKALITDAIAKINSMEEGTLKLLMKFLMNTEDEMVTQAAAKAKLMDSAKELAGLIEIEKDLEALVAVRS